MRLNLTHLSRHFEELLDRIIALKNNTGEDFQFWSEIIPNNDFNARIFSKMANPY